MNPHVDTLIARSKRWEAELRALRPLLLSGGLTEEVKWAKPCYCHEGRNIAIVQEMKEFLALMFFKGALLSDPDGVLVEQGPNSRSARRIEFRSVGEVEALAATVRAYLDEAIAVEDLGLAVAPASQLELVAELRARLDADAALQAAFAALTPGRQREYNLHIGEAKQAATRAGRVEKCVPKILAGKGFRDR